MGALTTIVVCGIAVLWATSVQSVIRSLRFDERDTTPWPASDRMTWRLSRGFPVAFFAVGILLPPVALDGLGLVDGELLTKVVSVMLSLGVTGLFAAIFVGLTGWPAVAVPKNLRPGGSQESLIK